jgi:hypothetical protein
MGKAVGRHLPSINYTLNLGMEKKYKQLDLKISKLVAAQAEKPRTKTLFYPRVIIPTSHSLTRN